MGRYLVDVTLTLEVECDDPSGIDAEADRFVDDLDRHTVALVIGRTVVLDHRVDDSFTVIER